ncbi:MAG: hypothetical protein HZA54_15035, partial [Planctomycetes bacterium]|nr:hypothetical protein [Planctomycetota bacterium]
MTLFLAAPILVLAPDLDPARALAAVTGAGAGAPAARAAWLRTAALA